MDYTGFGLHFLYNLTVVQIVSKTTISSHKINKRPMGHIAHLRKQFKSINTYDNIITLIKKTKKNIIIFMRIKCFFLEQN